MTKLNTAPTRILAVAARTPWPLSHGGHLRLFHFLRNLARNAEVTLAVPGTPEHANAMPDGVSVVGMNETMKTGHWTPSNAWTMRRARQYFGYDPTIGTWLHEHAQAARYDVALLFGCAMGRYADAFRIPVVWDVVDEPTLYHLRDAWEGGWRRWPAALKAAAFSALYQRHVAQLTATCLYTSPLDSAYARRWIHGTRVKTLTNGVDFDYFSPAARPPASQTIAFVGSFQFPPNVECMQRFARTIWPALHSANPSRRLLIVGRTPTAEIRALTACPGIEVHGDVPDVRPYLARASAVIVPTRLGGGVKNKVLEACAAGRPVIASSRALDGLTARHGVDVLCADRDEAWIKRISQVLDDPGVARDLGRRGLAWVHASHGWPVLTEQLRAILKSAAAKRPFVPRDIEQAESTATATLESPRPSAPKEEVVCR